MIKVHEFHLLMGLIFPSLYFLVLMFKNLFLVIKIFAKIILN